MESASGVDSICCCKQRRKMKQILWCAILLMAIIEPSCKGSDSEPTSPPAASGGLTASPPGIHIAPGASSVVSIRGGTRPESIIGSPNGSVATASLSDTVLTVQGVAVGSTSVRVGDQSTPQKTVSISITIATSAAALIAP